MRRPVRCFVVARSSREAKTRRMRRYGEVGRLLNVVHVAPFFGWDAVTKRHSCSTVCIKFMDKFIKRIDDTHTDRTDQDATELLLIKTCKEATGKEERLVRHGSSD